MTANNEESRPRWNNDHTSNERHYASNNNREGYQREPRTQNERSYHSPDKERSYHSSNRERNAYNPNYRSHSSGHQQHSNHTQDGEKKRRVRVGERVVLKNDEQRPYNSGYRPHQTERRSYNNDRDGGYDNRGSRPQRPYGQGKKLIKKRQPFAPVKYKENADPNEPLRLNKYLSNAGICSRREADEFIQAGAVKVNGVVITELGTKITRADTVLFHDQLIKPESKVYVLLNKPKGFVTTTDDPENRKTVMDLVKSAASERIYPVGRLDRSTTGVLLLTNDGDLASKLTHPKYEKRKIYQVWLDKPVGMIDMQKIADGIELEDGEIHADAISYVTEDDLSVVGIEIHSGRNRIVRRIFEKLGYRVIKLDRVYFAGLTKKKLARGKWRYLAEKEVNMLRMGAFD